ncbi:hypothetical protein TNIN_287831 [Trichonephila inaurata madagascariensis]|uniref:Uncharacterized protein n=1 Tax=Trichonephila inaurata madagascariensis TaxID=2747483 RepID=A0A8X6Y8V0_9ARAC|nr:hypothetical protein TNIN_287831 [Trichonephila inaurata madagascariensis]
MELEERKRRDEMDFELQKKRIELKEEHENEVKGPGQIKIDLHKLIPKFDSRNMILVREHANKKEKAYDIQDDLLVPNDIVCGEPIKQVVLPAGNRKEILQMAHEIPLVGHLGEQKNQATH